MAREIRAETPGLLSRLIVDVRAEIQRGSLVVLSEWEQAGSESQPTFLELPEGGPWPDFFEYRLCCNSCGQAFSLTAETYHGSGAMWRPINLDDVT